MLRNKTATVMVLTVSCATFAASYAIEVLISDYWVSFAALGDPSSEGLPEWLPHDRESEPYMAFGDSARLRHHLLEDRLDFLERFLARD